MSVPLQPQQLKFVVWVSQFRTENLDGFFRFLNYFDTEYFFFAVILILWFAVSYKWGLRIFFLMFSSMLINHWFKLFFAWPRPCTDMPEVGLFHFKTNGFPSGATQTAFLLGGLFIIHWKEISKNSLPRTGWIIGITYILLISFSRIYLGVHYPLDLLGGMLIGLFLLEIFIQSIDPLERWLKKRGPYFSFFLIEGVLFCLLWAPLTRSLQKMVFGAIGIGIGAFLSYKYHLLQPEAKTLTKKIERLFIGSISVYLIYLITDQGFNKNLQSFLIFLWISLIVNPLLFKIILLRK